MRSTSIVKWMEVLGIPSTITIPSSDPSEPARSGEDDGLRTKGASVGRHRAVSPPPPPKKKRTTTSGTRTNGHLLSGKVDGWIDWTSVRPKHGSNSRIEPSWSSPWPVLEPPSSRNVRPAGWTASRSSFERSCPSTSPAASMRSYYRPCPRVSSSSVTTVRDVTTTTHSRFRSFLVDADGVWARQGRVTIRSTSMPVRPGMCGYPMCPGRSSVPPPTRPCS